MNQQTVLTRCDARRRAMLMKLCSEFYGLVAIALVAAVTVLWGTPRPRPSLPRLRKPLGEPVLIPGVQIQ